MSTSERDGWQPELYQQKHSFVWKLAGGLVEQLAPAPGETILDLGCGSGELTQQIAESGATVIGLDNSPAMIEQAQHQFPRLTFKVGDAHSFQLDEPVDAIFSNAALHWIQRPGDVVARIAAALKPGGRFVAEFGGAGNVRCISRSLSRASLEFLGESVSHAWFFPTIGEFSTLLESRELEPYQAALIDRPTDLEGADGLRNWVRMFCGHWLDRVPTERQDEFLTRVEQYAEPDLRRSDDSWFADYVRLRVSARKVSMA